MLISPQPQHGNINVNKQSFINDPVWLSALQLNRNPNKPLLPTQTLTKKEDIGLERKK